MNLLDLPSYFSIALGVTPFMAGLIITTSLLISGILAVNLSTESNGGNFYTALVTFVIIGTAVALGWIPSWIFLMVTVTIAGLISKILKF
jgi:ABC-type sugar transport system permease subunit